MKPTAAPMYMTAATLKMVNCAGDGSKVSAVSVNSTPISARNEDTSIRPLLPGGRSIDAMPKFTPVGGWVHGVHRVENIS